MEPTAQKTSDTDRIQKRVLLRAAHSRVWRAISDAKEFGSWFGMKVDGAFEANRTVKCAITPTTVDPESAKSQKPYEGERFELYIEKIEPERLFSFRWHPFAIERDVDYSSEPTTLVTFELEPADGGVMLTVTESGFDRIPLERRAKAFAANEGGWTAQMQLIEKYLVQAS